MGERDAVFAGLEAFVAALAGAGVEHVCLTPGARSTPLVLAVAAHAGLRVWSHIDERSASFFALGLAKATRRPVALVCTSGTAAANFLPAVVEAFYARVPLLVLTADRPPELRDCGAGQTIDQIKLYGVHVKWFVEVGCGEAGARYFHALGGRAAAVAGSSPAGPVHLNFPFRDPLVPERWAAGAAREAGVRNDENETYAACHAGVAAPRPDTVRALAAALTAAPRGVIVCGPCDAGDEFPPAVARLAAAIGYPVLADATSQVRCGGHDTSMVVDAYEALLRADGFAPQMAPDVVLRFGAVPPSRAVLSFLQQRAACRQIVVDVLAPWNDPTVRAADLVACDPVATCVALCTQMSRNGGAVRSPADGWAAQWLDANRRAGAALQHHLERTQELFEGKVFAELAALLPDGAWVYVGNSMPVRDLDAFWPKGPRAVRVLCNRGANGIDGLVSSGLGAAAAGAAPVVIVTGDLGFYHDLNGLLAVKRLGVRATIIVINNDGGGIFSFLPQADCGDACAEYFFTPHGLDFRGVVEMYGAAFTRVGAWEHFRTAVREALDAEHTSVIEVPSDRRRNVELHRRAWAVAAAQV